VPDPRDVLTNARIELARFPLDMLATAAPSRLTTAVAPPRAGELSGLDIVTAWVEHDRLHLTQLGATLARLWASR
jgi:hypothetical protein